MSIVIVRDDERLCAISADEVVKVVETGETKPARDVKSAATDEDVAVETSDGRRLVVLGEMFAP